MSFSIRPYHIDAHACAEVYFHAVQRGTHEKYTEAQRNAWAPKIPDPLTYLADETCVIAEAKRQGDWIHERDGRTPYFNGICASRLASTGGCRSAL